MLFLKKIMVIILSISIISVQATEWYDRKWGEYKYEYENEQ